MHGPGAYATDQLQIHGEPVPIADVDDVQTFVDVLLRRQPPYSPDKYRKAVLMAQLWLRTWEEHAALIDRQERNK